jgi:hypothetical protein
MCDEGRVTLGLLHLRWGRETLATSDISYWTFRTLAVTMLAD